MRLWTLGFAFSPDTKDILLYRKAPGAELHPDQWNGFGGKLETGPLTDDEKARVKLVGDLGLGVTDAAGDQKLLETPERCMVREGLEESWIDLPWRHYANLTNSAKTWQVYCFYAIIPALSADDQSKVTTNPAVSYFRTEAVCTDAIPGLVANVAPLVSLALVSHKGGRWTGGQAPIHWLIEN